MLIPELLAWYRQHKRQLPWRANRDPYRVLVSEFMLQQTRVEAVLEHYRRFLQRFPNVESLARADIQDVLTVWSGLGYYRRAHFLHQTAQAVVARGGFPETESELRQLPGLGEYTAAALVSIAMGQSALALDGNAIRVLSRIFAERGPITTAVRARWRAEIVPAIAPQDAGDFTQALMELGATTCVPRSPRCLTCPLSHLCAARAENLTDLIPPPKAKAKSVDVDWSVGLLRRHEKVLLVRSVLQPFLRDNWLPPWGADLAELRARTPAAVDWRSLGQVRHGVTFRNLTLHVYAGQMNGEALPDKIWQDYLWADLHQLDRHPLSSLTRKVLRLAVQN